jgi:polyphosphate kinase
VRDPVARQRAIDEGLKAYLADNRDAWLLDAKGTWTKVSPRARARGRSAQAELLARLQATGES